MNQKTLSNITISITPFDESGRLDEAAFKKHLRRLGDGGVSVYVAGSGSSEGYALTPEERDRVLEIAVDELKGKGVQVRAMGCEPRMIPEMVEYVRRAEHYKVDAAMIFSLDMGHGAKPTVTEMEKYYSTVIEATSLPVVLSSHHAVGYFLPLDMVERLARRYPTLLGICYGGNNVGQLADMINRLGDRLEVHCTGARNSITTLCLGGNGFMGHDGNFAPRLCSSIISAFQAKDIDRLSASFRKLVALAEIFGRYGGSTLRGLKPLLNAFGLPGGTLRLPRIALSSEEIDKMVQEVLRLQIPEAPPLAAPRSP